MFTLIAIIFSFITLCVMSEMSTDSNCQSVYYVPCIMTLIMCGKQILSAGIKWLNGDSFSYYNNRYGEYDYYDNFGNPYITPNHYQQSTHYKRYKPPISMKKEVSKKCKRNFTITIEKTA